MFFRLRLVALVDYKAVSTSHIAQLLASYAVKIEMFLFTGKFTFKFNV